jgi:hypothetical protein
MKRIFSICFCIFFVLNVNAQVKIGGVAEPPHISAVLELDGGTTRGLLLPRMRKLDIDAIVNPAEGLTIYATELQAIFLRRSGNWIKVNGDGDGIALPYFKQFDYNGSVFTVTNQYANSTAIQGVNGGNGYGVRGSSANGIGINGFGTDASGIGGYFTHTLGAGGRSLISIGKTGIGTESPISIFHVDGGNAAGKTVTIDDDENPVIQMQKAGINKGYLQTDINDMVMATNITNNTGRVIFRTADVDRLFVDQLGHTGIGAASINARLYIDGLNTSATTMILNDQNPVIQFRNNGENVGVIQTNGNDFKIGTNFENSSASIIMRTKGVDRFWLDSNGHVGIGARPSLSHTLKVGGGIVVDNDFSTGSGPALYFQKTYPDNSVLTMGVLYASTDYIRFTSTARGYEFGENNGDKWLRLNKTTGYANFQERIGISTDNPTAKLYINGVGDATTAMIINGTDAVLQIQDNGTSKGFIRTDGNDMVIGTNISNTSGKTIIRTNNTDRLYVANNGQVTIGGDVPPAGGYKLAVKGEIAATDFIVRSLGAWPDYVFEPNYKLKTLDEVESFIKDNKHLPNIPDAAAVAKNGFAISDMQKRMMEKIEELTLYLIEAKKEINELKNKFKILEEK